MDGLDYNDAWDLSQIRAAHSNTSRCYISVIQALIRIQGRADDKEFVEFTAKSILDDIKELQE